MQGLASGLGSAPDIAPNFWDTAPDPQPLSDQDLPRSKKDDTFNNVSSSPKDYEEIKQSVIDKYPALTPHVKDAIIYKADRDKDHPEDQLETYPPWEEYNPNPGKTSIELRRDYKTKSEATDAIAGDLIHIAGAIHPDTHEPVDPYYYSLKKEVKKARSTKDISMDYKAYKEEEGDKPSRSFSKWFDESRGEAYVRGRVMPDENDERSHVYKSNPKLKKTIDKISKYLRTGKKDK